MLWCFFYLKGLTVWLCFMVYFGFMCIKHAMIWLQLKDLRWSSPWVCLIWKNLPFIPAEFIFGTICLYLWYCEFSILKIAIFVMLDVYLLCIFLQKKFQTLNADALLTLMLFRPDCQLFSLSGISLCAGHDCSNHSDLETEGECLTKNLLYLRLNISTTKKW